MANQFFDDLGALAEATIEDGGSFQDVVRTIRTELCQPNRPGCGLKDAVHYAEVCLTRLTNNATAQAVLQRWENFQSAAAK